LPVCKGLQRLLLIFVTLLATGLLAPAAGAARPMQTGIELFSGDAQNMNANIDLAAPKVKAAGANYVRLILLWRNVSPSPTASTMPSIDPADPASYNWAGFDNYVDAAVQARLIPLITVWQAPRWAEDRRSTDLFNGRVGTVRPNAVLFGKFAQAAAKHYLDRYQALHPTLHIAWEAWNEPNFGYFLMPQKNLDGSWYGPVQYRNLLNKFYAGIHASDPSALVVGGSTGPFGNKRKPGPLLFLRKVFCLSDTNRAKGSCGAHADAWSTHPYTQGGPTHHAVSPYNVSLGDLPEMRRAITAAVRVGHLKSIHAPVRFWVSEFGWDSNGPDSGGVPLWLHARWTSEALYRSWKAGVSLFIFHQLRDRPQYYQSGLYFCGLAALSDNGTSTGLCENSNFSFDNDVKKKSWRAAYFPFVAFAANGRVTIWGRTPNSTPGQTIVIQRKTSSGYRKLFTLKANGVGIFTKSWSTSLSRGFLRARIGGSGTLSGTLSVPFSLARVPDRPVNPWGTQ
jgi:hypothetical protein